MNRLIVIILVTVACANAVLAQEQTSIDPASIYHPGGMTVISPNQPGWVLLQSGESLIAFQKRAEGEVLNASVKTIKTKVFDNDDELLTNLEALKVEELSKLKRDSVHFNYVRFKASPCVQYDGIFTGDASAPNFKYLNFNGYRCRHPESKGLVVQIEFANHSNLRGFSENLVSLSNEFFEKIVFSKVRHSPLLKGVDHFFASSSDPETLFKFFRDTLGLPQVWDFRNFGDFASGGVWMGNVEFEVVTWKPSPGEKVPTEFKGIAFEPVGYTDSLIEELARRAIKHTESEPTLMKDKEGREYVGWINTPLDGPGGMTPSNVSIFVYDSTSKEKKAARNERSNSALQKSQGGPLGVVAVKELAIGVVDLKTARLKWRMLLDRPDQETGNLYRFSQGPGIRLFAAPTDGFESIVLQVRSLRKAKEFLVRRNLLDRSRDNTVAIDPLAIGGLRIILEQVNLARRVPKVDR